MLKNHVTSALLVAALIAGCGSDEPIIPFVDATTDTATDSAGEDTTVDATSSDTVAEPDAIDDTRADVAPDVPEGVPPAEDLGGFCPFGCDLDLCADTESTDCSTGVCLYEGFDSWAYCTQPCTDGECPEAYSCETADDGTGDWCKADRAVCGDGILQRTEPCDDGNTEGRDLCAPDCSAETYIPSFGTFSFGRPDGAPSIYDGEEPRVYAYRSVFDDGRTNLVIGTAQNDQFSIEISDIDNLVAPISGPALAYSLFSVCNYRSDAATVTVDSHDPVARTISGSFETVLVCWAGCFDCGGDGDERVYVGEFDVTYIDRPEL
ncbi:MAG: cysteine-rich repeat protein [Bradymonadia bacterium]|jgi:cysteine-rich repeat protein